MRADRLHAINSLVANSSIRSPYNRARVIDRLERGCVVGTHCSKRAGQFVLRGSDKRSHCVHTKNGRRHIQTHRPKLERPASCCSRAVLSVPVTLKYSKYYQYRTPLYEADICNASVLFYTIYALMCARTQYQIYVFVYILQRSRD